MMKIAFVKVLVSLALGLGILFTSCEKEDKVLDPTLTLDGGNQYVAADREVEPGTRFAVKLTANKGADGKNIDKVEVRVSYAGAVAIRDTIIENINQASYTLVRNLTARQVEGTERWIFTATDKDGKTAERSFTITVKKKDTIPTPKPPKSFNITFNKDNAFASSSDGLVYNAANGQANASKVDLTYFFSTTSQNNLASPQARKDASIYANFAITWGVVATEFRTVNATASDFDALNDEDRIKTLFDAGTPTVVVNNPPGTRINGVSGDYVPNKVIAFQNKSTGKYGLLKIVSVANNDAGSSSIALKVQN
jgi:hypothetical protein